MLTNKLRKAHGLFYQNKMQEEKQNLKVMWDIFGSVINPKKMKQSSKINSLIIENKKIINGKTIIETTKVTDDQEIANSVNNFFSSIGSKLAEQHNAHKKYLTNKINSTMYLFPTNQIEIANLILNLNPKKNRRT